MNAIYVIFVLRHGIYLFIVVCDERCQVTERMNTWKLGPWNRYIHGSLFVKLKYSVSFIFKPKTNVTWSIDTSFFSQLKEEEKKIVEKNLKWNSKDTCVTISRIVRDLYNRALDREKRRHTAGKRKQTLSNRIVRCAQLLNLLADGARGTINLFISKSEIDKTRSDFQYLKCLKSEMKVESNWNETERKHCRDNSKTEAIRLRSCVFRLYVFFKLFCCFFLILRREWEFTVLSVSLHCINHIPLTLKRCVCRANEIEFIIGWQQPIGLMTKAHAYFYVHQAYMTSNCRVSTKLTTINEQKKEKRIQCGWMYRVRVSARAREPTCECTAYIRQERDQYKCARKDTQTQWPLYRLI